MRLRKRPQGRIPLRLAPTHWEIVVYTGETPLGWEGDTLVGLHQWLIQAKPDPTDRVLLYRNGRCIYDGTWHDLAGDPTLW